MTPPAYYPPPRRRLSPGWIIFGAIMLTCLAGCFISGVVSALEDDTGPAPRAADTRVYGPAPDDLDTTYILARCTTDLQAQRGARYFLDWEHVNVVQPAHVRAPGLGDDELVAGEFWVWVLDDGGDETAEPVDSGFEVRCWISSWDGEVHASDIRER